MYTYAQRMAHVAWHGRDYSYNLGGGGGSAAQKVFFSTQKVSKGSRSKLAGGGVHSADIYAYITF